MEICEVFVSYKKVDEALACLISEKLKQRGITVFYDVESPRCGKYDEEQLSVLKSSKNLIIMLSSNSLAECHSHGDWIRLEIISALESGKNIIPIFMGEFNYPEELSDDIADIKQYDGISTNQSVDGLLKQLLERIEVDNTKQIDRISKYVNNDETLSQFSELIGNVKKKSNPDDCCRLAKLYLSLETREFNEEIYSLYQRGSKAEHASAKNGLGYCYQYGIGVEQNYQTAFDYYKSAADQGEPSAQYHLAVLIEKYNSYLAFNYYKRLASYKSASSTIIRKVAECYEEGFGTKKNYEMARALYLKALEMGEKGVEDKTKEKYWKKKKLRDMWDA